MRASNFELLRIIAMILIIMHHFAVHGGFEHMELGASMNRIWIQILSGGGRLGVDIFVLISGYFLIDSEYKPQKLIKFVLQVMEYAMLCSILLILIGEIQISSIKGAVTIIKTAILPIPYGEYWFATTYFVLYLFSPYLNRLIKNIDKKMHLKLIVTGIVIWCIFPSVLKTYFGFSYVGWFTILYFIAAYLRLYPVNSKNMKRNCWIIAGASYFLLLVLIITIDILGMKYPILISYIASIREMNSPVVLVCAIATVFAFGTLSIQSKMVNRIAATTFGIYLLHDNPQIRNFLWSKTFHVNAYAESRFFILYSLLVIGIIFCICCVVEILRAKLSKKFIESYIVIRN